MVWAKSLITKRLIASVCVMGAAWFALAGGLPLITALSGGFKVPGYEPIQYKGKDALTPAQKAKYQAMLNFALADMERRHVSTRRINQFLWQMHFFVPVHYKPFDCRATLSFRPTDESTVKENMADMGQMGAAMKDAHDTFPTVFILENPEGEALNLPDDRSKTVDESGWSEEKIHAYGDKLQEFYDLNPKALSATGSSLQMLAAASHMNEAERIELDRTQLYSSLLWYFMKFYAVNGRDSEQEVRNIGTYGAENDADIFKRFRVNENRFELYDFVDPLIISCGFNLKYFVNNGVHINDKYAEGYYNADNDVSPAVYWEKFQ